MIRTRKIFYNLSNGNVIDIADGDEVFGEVHGTTWEEAFRDRPSLKNIDPLTVDMLEFGYLDRKTEFDNMGSCHIDPTAKVLTIYQRLTISTDKAQITANGIDTATITVTVQDTVSPHTISFTVNNGTQVAVNTADGVAVLPMTTTLTGDYIVTATSDIYGTNSVTVKGV